MAIWVNHQTVITCDVCQLKDFIEAGRRKDNVKLARKYGWKIGRKVTCPDCLRKDKQQDSRG